MEKKLRKRENLLVDAGKGVILFAVWSVAKVNLYLGMSSFILEELHKAALEYGISEKALIVLMGSLLAVILLWMLGSRLYIGLNAIAEGKGKKKGWAYLVLTAILLLTDMQSFWQVNLVSFLFGGLKNAFSMSVSFVLELVSLYILLELLICGIRVKRLRKMEKE